MKYVNIIETEYANRLRIEVEFVKKSGYCLTIYPEKAKYGMVSVCIGAGFYGSKTLLVPASRQSEKAHKKALLIAEDIEQDEINSVLAKNGFKRIGEQNNDAINAN